MNDYFSKWRANRTVLVRTKAGPGLPESLLYVGGDGGDGKRAMLGPDGNEQRIANPVLQSHYKLATGTKADELIASQWPKTQVRTQPVAQAKPQAAPPANAPSKTPAKKKQAARGKS